MKDFPIDELHAASSLEAIQFSVASIYGHLRKIRTTSYPAQRAIFLVEAISRDLNTQLLKVREGSEAALGREFEFFSFLQC